MKNTKTITTNEDGTKQVKLHESHRYVNVEDIPVGDPKKSKELILYYKYSCGQLFAHKVGKKNHERIAQPDKENMKIKPLVFNTAGVTDEENSSAEAASEDDGDERDHYET